MDSSKKIIFIGLIMLLVIFFFISIKSTKTSKREQEDITGNSEDVEISKEIVFLYSNPMKKNSYLSKVIDGEETEEVKLDYIGLSMLNFTPERNILITSDSHHHNVIIDPNKLEILSQKKIKFPITFYNTNSQMEVYGYNIDTEKNIIKLKSDMGEFEYEVPPLITQVAISNKYVYVFSDIIEKEKSALYRIDRKSGTKKKIGVNANFALDMELVKDKLIISTRDQITVYNQRTEKIDYLDFKGIKYFDKIYKYNEYIYISYIKNNKTGILVLNQDLKEVDSIDFNFSHTMSKYNDDAFYFISSIDYGSSNTLHIVDLNKLQLVKEYKVPKKDHKLQDFLMNCQ